MLAVVVSSLALAGPTLRSAGLASGARAVSIAPSSKVMMVTTESPTSAPPAKEARSAREWGLALKLDDGTRKSHSIAENTAFVSGFFRGIATQEAFAQLVASLAFVYEEMERAFDTTDDPHVRALDMPELRRSAALAKDMEYLHGADWRERVQPTAATRAYVARIRAIASSDRPWLLIGHQYTRYLGDLFGGQMMAGMARRSLKLPSDGRGTYFYAFDDVGDIKTFIESWYGQLNTLGLDESAQQAIVDEANAVFALNIALFDELSGQPWRAAYALFTRALVDWDARFA